MMMKPLHIDFDEGDGSLYEFDEAGNPVALFTVDPECPLDTFEEFKDRAARIVKAVNCHDALCRMVSLSIKNLMKTAPDLAFEMSEILSEIKSS